MSAASFRNHALDDVRGDFRADADGAFIWC